MASEHVVYEFGEFDLDSDERVLRRRGAPVALTPKATEILLALIENRGHIVEKADLMRQVWADTAVEDGNLSQNIYTLRRILSDAEGKCAFIETVPRRGYRFVGDVRILASGVREQATAHKRSRNGAGLNLTVDPAGRPESTRTTNQSSSLAPPRWIVAVLGTGLLGSAALGLFSNTSVLDGTNVSIARVSRVTSVGNVVRATITDDGRAVVYAAVTGSQESLWAKNLDSGNPVQLIEPAVGTYRRGGGLSSGPAGWVYYTWFRPDRFAVEIFRIRPEHGRPEAVPNVRDLPAFDGQGKRFACITTTSMTVAESRLLVYDGAGEAPRAVATLRPPLTFLQMRPAWSPDGTHLAAWTSSAEEPGIHTLLVIAVEDGRERIITKKRLHAVDGMVWLADGTGLIVSAREAASAPPRLWEITFAPAMMRPLTNDVSDYLLAGLITGRRQLAAVRVDVARTLWVAPVTGLERARQVASDAGELSELESLAWMRDGRLLYTSTESGNADIWVYDPDKDERRQLTTNDGDDFSPASSPDGAIAFASDRAGATGIWVMSDAGERSARQLTAEGDSRPTASPDGSVVFQRGVIQSAPIALWRVPMAGGAAVQLTQGVVIRPSVSPDGRLVAYYWLTPEGWTLAVMPLNGGNALQVFPLSPTHCGRTVRWSPDSQSLAFIDCADGVSNIWLQNLDGSPARKMTDFQSGHIATFDWSRDGSRLAWTTRNQLSDVVLIAH